MQYMIPLFAKHANIKLCFCASDKQTDILKDGVFVHGLRKISYLIFKLSKPFNNPLNYSKSASSQN